MVFATQQVALPVRYFSFLLRTSSSYWVSKDNMWKSLSQIIMNTFVMLAVLHLVFPSLMKCFCSWSGYGIIQLMYCLVSYLAYTKVPREDVVYACLTGFMAI